MSRRKLFYTILILLNAVCLYFIIDLLNYDEIIGYDLGGEKMRADSRSRFYLFFLTSLSNFYFLAFTIIERAFIDKI